jgi:hypothetical protein
MDLTVLVRAAATASEWEPCAPCSNQRAPVHHRSRGQRIVEMMSSSSNLAALAALRSVLHKSVVCETAIMPS